MYQVTCWVVLHVKSDCSVAMRRMPHIECNVTDRQTSVRKHGSFSIISFLYIPTIADDVAIGLLKLQINWVIWFIQIKKKQHFLANYCTYLPGEIRRSWNELLRISREDQRASPNSQPHYEHSEPKLDVLNAIISIKSNKSSQKHL